MKENNVKHQNALTPKCPCRLKSLSWPDLSLEEIFDANFETKNECSYYRICLEVVSIDRRAFDITDTGLEVAIDWDRHWFLAFSRQHLGCWVYTGLSRSKSSKFIFFYLKPGCALTELVTINYCTLWVLNIYLLVIKGNNVIYRGLLTSDTFMIMVMLTGEDIYFDVWFIITHVNKPPHPPPPLIFSMNAMWE